MGHKGSVIKVTSKVSVPNDCGILDAIRVSYKKNTWCGAKRRVVASFTFPRDNWRQLFPEDHFHNQSAKLAKVHIAKLMKKDRETPVMVNCLAAGVSVFNIEMSLANFLARLQYTQVGGEILLSFSFRGRRLQGAGELGYAFTAMFINGKWFSGGNPRHRLEPPQYHQTASTCEEDEYSPETERKMKEWEEFVANTYNDVWEVDISPEMDPPHKDLKDRKTSEDNMKPAQGTRDEKTRKGEAPARGFLWDLVAGCAGVVAFMLFLYIAWLEYDKYN